MSYTKECHKAFGRIFLSFGISTELWYNILENKSKRTHLIALGWYDSSAHNSRMYVLTVLGLTFKVGYLKY